MMIAGHAQGTVTLWSPASDKPAVKTLCHRGPVRSIAVDKGGHTLVTAGLDSFVCVWDLRTYKQLHSYRSLSAAASVDISQRGLLAVGEGAAVSVWPAEALTAHQGKPYMRCVLPTRHDVVESVAFCPWEDVLGIGHSRGFSSAVVPGAGEPNLDSLEANPFASRQQRREGDVHALLDKAPYDSISVDPTVIGTVASSRVKASVAEWTDGSKQLSKQALEERKIRQARLKRLQEAEQQQQQQQPEDQPAGKRGKKKRAQAAAPEVQDGGAEGGEDDAATRAAVRRSALDRFK